jgi:hypothetical protein
MMVIATTTGGAGGSDPHTQIADDAAIQPIITMTLTSTDISG